MENVIQAVLQKTLEISEKYIFIENREELINKIVNSEFSIVKRNNGIKILDGDNDMELDDGVFVYFSSPASLVTVKKGKSSKKEIDDDKACYLLALSYIVRILSLLPDSRKDDILTITREINSLI